MTMTAALNEAETDLPEITFDGGLPGFPMAQHFALVSWDEGPFATLQCLDDTSLEFVVVPPVVFFPDYEPEIDDPTCERIGLTAAEDALIIVIVTVGAEVSDSTANLFAPVIINTKTNSGIQAVLTGSDHDLRARLI